MKNIRIYVRDLFGGKDGTRGTACSARVTSEVFRTFVILKKLTKILNYFLGQYTWCCSLLLCILCIWTCHCPDSHQGMRVAVFPSRDWTLFAFKTYFPHYIEHVGGPASGAQARPHTLNQIPPPSNYRHTDTNTGSFTRRQQRRNKTTRKLHFYEVQRCIFC